MRVLSWLVVVAGAAACDESVPQSAECATFVACIVAIDTAASQTTNLERYVEGGACWANENLERSCTTSCERTLARMRERMPGLPVECLP